MKNSLLFVILLFLIARVEATPKAPDAQLLQAAEKSETIKAQELIKGGANVNARNMNGTTPLMFAARRYNEPLLNWLLLHGANARATDKEGLSALGYGPLLAEPLSKYGAKATPRDNGILSDSLENSIWVDSDLSDEEVREETELFLRLGGNLNTRGYDEYGFTPLLNAAASRVSFVPYLLSRGADPNISDKDGRTPLMAVLEPNPIEGSEKAKEAALLLMKYGAKLNNRDMFGETALIMAVQNNYPTIVRELLSRGANPNICDKRGQSALMRAATGGHASLARLLLKAGANPKLKDANGQTALDYALSRTFAFSSQGAIPASSRQVPAPLLNKFSVPTPTPIPTPAKDPWEEKIKQISAGRMEIADMLRGKRK